MPELNAEEYAGINKFANDASGALERKWIEALRSGEYRQCRGALVASAGQEQAYCCLGVLGKVMQKEGYLPEGVMGEGGDGDSRLVTEVPYTAAQRRYGEMHKLVDWNDTEAADFNTIADRIEKKLTSLPGSDIKRLIGESK